MEVNKEISQFAKDVEVGLSKEHKMLPSKYFYDKKGDELFVSIMNSEEYYPTDCEMEIFTEQSAEIIEAFDLKGELFNLVELGAGDGTKTIHLLNKLIELGNEFIYKPLDISENAVKKLSSFLASENEKINIDGIVGDYFKTLSNAAAFGSEPKVILFIGSNLGNMSEEQAIMFLTSIKNKMNANDKLLLGLDLKKDPKVILAAYNDKEGFTADFNLNLLDRINKELGGDFKRDQFSHWPIYEANTGKAKSFLVSKCKQTVYIESINKTYTFEAFEAIHTEISQKYDFNMIERISKEAGLRVTKEFKDSKNYFTDIILEKI